MKYNYIFNSVNLDNITIPKQVVSKEYYKKLKEERKKRKERLYNKRIPRSYKIYIKSVFWTKRRNKYLKDFGRKCFICDSVKYSQVHHLEYDYNYYSKEEDKMLVCLCKDCHDEFHLNYQTKRKMYDEFDEFVNLKKLAKGENCI